MTAITVVGLVALATVCMATTACVVVAFLATAPARPYRTGGEQ